MEKIDIKKIKSLQSFYKSKNFNPKSIFNNLSSNHDCLLILSFFLTTMALEILLNQPFQKKIGIIHNYLFKPFTRNANEKVERIENNSFGFCLLIVFRKMYFVNRNTSSIMKNLFGYSIIHWAGIQNFSNFLYKKKREKLEELWNKNYHFTQSVDQESLIDLIIELYKSFEIGIGDKKIIKKNVATLIYSVSKANKEFRFDVLEEFGKKFKFGKY